MSTGCNAIRHAGRGRGHGDSNVFWNGSTDPAGSRRHETASGRKWLRRSVMAEGEPVMAEEEPVMAEWGGL